MMISREISSEKEFYADEEQIFNSRDFAERLTQDSLQIIRTIGGKATTCHQLFDL